MSDAPINPAIKQNVTWKVTKLTVMLNTGEKFVFPIEPETIDALKRKVVHVSKTSRSRTIQHPALLDLNLRLFRDDALYTTGIYGDYLDEVGQKRRFALAGHSVRE
jgi:hypothetical protein